MFRSVKVADKGSLFRRALAGRIPETIRQAGKPPERQRVQSLTRAMDAAHGLLLAQAREVDIPRLFPWLDYAALDRLLRSPLPEVKGIGWDRHFVHRQAARLALLSAGWADLRMGRSQVG